MNRKKPDQVSDPIWNIIDTAPSENEEIPCDSGQTPSQAEPCFDDGIFSKIFPS